MIGADNSKTILRTRIYSSTILSDQYPEVSKLKSDNRFPHGKWPYGINILLIIW